VNNNEENILNCILPRLIAVTKGDAILALQVIQGPYVGVTFSFKKFVISTEKTTDGMAPARFETAVHESPAGFEKNEAFDNFCSEVLLSWLHFISVTNFDTLLKSETKGVH
jgi:hypothetical protein